MSDDQTLALAGLGHWPGFPAPVPRVAVPSVQAEGDMLVYGTDWSEVEVIQLPDELYVREFLRLDTGSMDDVLAFSRSYGKIVRDDHRALPPGLVVQIMDSKPKPASFYAMLEEGTREHVYTLPALDSARMEEARPRPPEWGFTPREDVADYQAVLANMVLLWRCINGEISDRDLENDWIPQAGPPLGGMTAPELANALIWMLNPSLVPFHVRLHAKDDPTLGLPLVSTYEAMCLQFANHISEGATYRQCLSETCGRLFVRQQGRAEFGQYRTEGVLYCSSACAQAQAQREYRRRKAKQRAAKHPGPSRESGQS